MLLIRLVFGRFGFEFPTGTFEFFFPCLITLQNCIICNHVILPVVSCALWLVL